MVFIPHNYIGKSLGSVERQIGSVANTLTSTASQALNRTLPNIMKHAEDLVPADTRRMLSGVFKGANINTKIGGVPGVNVNLKNAETLDWRVKLRAKDPRFYTGAMLEPLKDFQGLMFPYTPALNIVHTSHHNTDSPTHSNYPVVSYQNSTVDTINISADFTAQDHDEGLYCMAAIYFMRSITKMFAGQDANAGTPPPLLFLEGYGTHILPSVPVVVTTAFMDFPGDVDYISVNPAQSRKVTSSTVHPGTVGITKDVVMPSGNITKVPTHFSLNFTMHPAHSRTSLSKDFSLNEFMKGNMAGNNKRGGFI